MKRFAFTLEGLLRLKRQRERLAELLAARARAECDAARGRTAELRGRLDRLAASLNVGAAASTARWVAAAAESARLARDLDAAEQDVRLAQERFAEAAGRRVRLTQEVEALQTLRQQEWAEYRRDAVRAEQQRLDELSLGRWQPPAAAPRANDQRP